MSALDPIGRSPFLPWWNLHKVELFSAFISHLEMICQAGNVDESVSLFNLKEKNYTKDTKIGTHDLDGPVYYANNYRPLRTCWMEMKLFKYI